MENFNMSREEYNEKVDLKDKNYMHNSNEFSEINRI